MNKSLIFKTFGLYVAMAALCLFYPVQNAWAQTDSGITLKMENARLESVLDAIEQQSKYLFLNDRVDLDRTVSIDVADAGIEPVLETLFSGLDVEWRIEGTNIYISAKKVARESTGGGGSQDNRISGKIIDDTGLPVIGAGVLIQGTTVGTSTDLDGNFSFDLPEDIADPVLEVSCLGYTSQLIPVGVRRVFDITMETDAIMMEGTVVTALGIKRSEKALSYNVQEVKSDELLANKDANFINSLSGKVAGLVINASSSGVGGASKVVMRGQKSISKSSNALYVIDGVPMFTSAAEGGTEFDSRGSMDPVADINPEDIESMTVLTGAAAAALYGSAAANGAIVITTKQGQEGKTSVTVTSNTEVFTPFVLPRFQNRYGTGDYSSIQGSATRSWGDRLNDYNNPGYNPRKDYFQTGVTGTETVSLSTGNDKNQTYMSAGAVNSRGNVPNNRYDRYNFTFRNTTKFFDDKMTLDVSANYVIQRDLNTTNQGVYNNPIVGAYLFPRGDSWDAIEMYERWNPVRKIYTQYWPVGDAGMAMQNPYWVNYRNLRESKKNRYMLSAALSYDILDWLTVSGRIRVDNSVTKYTEKFYATTFTELTEGSNNGLFGIEQSEDKQFYADALVDINKTWEDWSLHANIGASITDMRNDLFSNRGPIASDNIPNIFNVYTIDAASMVKKQTGWREQTQSVYASAEIGFKSAYYLTLTGRNDWPSQLAGPRSVSSSFFYPSVGASVVLSEVIPNMPRQLEYVKIRGSYASVGSPFERWLANPVHEWPEKGNSWATETVYPMDQLKPERTNSWEVGLTMRFLNWFSLDATWYNTHTRNQTFAPNISTGSGYSVIYIQSGDVLNQGFELALGFDKEWGKFNWSSNYTFSTNRNKIVSLADNAINPVTGEALNITSLDMGGLGNALFILKEGGTLGDLYSRQDFQRDSEGAIYVDNNGNVTTQSISNIDDYIKLGSVLPKANMAWRNDFRLGNFNFGFMITARLGGIVYSRTQAVLDYYGVSEASADARDNGVFINGSDSVDPNVWYTAVAGGNTLPQYYTYSATNVRLQEASIGYTFPRKMLNNVCELTLQLVGKNLWMIYNKAPFDPESIATTGNYYQGIDYFMMPSTRNFGFNIRLKF